MKSDLDKRERRRHLRDRTSWSKTERLFQGATSRSIRLDSDFMSGGCCEQEFKLFLQTERDAKGALKGSEGCVESSVWN